MDKQRLSKLKNKVIFERALDECNAKTMNSEVLHVVREKDPWIVEEDVEKNWFSERNDPPEISDKKGRRKSWHAIKFERKRRKGVVESTTPPEQQVRQKRPSWWNIFANPQFSSRYDGVIRCDEAIEFETCISFCE